jgi:hypothetical protein
MQGGCMAIEDGYQLSLTLDEAVHSVQPGAPVDIEGALRKYQSVSSVLQGCAHTHASSCWKTALVLSLVVNQLHSGAHVFGSYATSCGRRRPPCICAD